MSPFTDIKDYQKFVKDKAKESAELKQKVVQEYQLGLKAGTGEVSLRMSLKERFDLTDRRLNNILDNQIQYLNAKEQAFTSGLVMNHYVTLIKAANEAIQGLDEYVEHINREMESGIDFIDMEQYASGKGVGVKALTPREALRSVLREKVDIVRESFEPLKALAPKIIQVQDGTPRYNSLEEIQKEKAILRKQLKLEEIEGEDEES